LSESFGNAVTHADTEVEETTMLQKRNLWFMLLGDAVLVILAYYGAYLVRFDGHVPPFYLAGFKQTILWVVFLKLLCFHFFRQYKGMWRYTSILDIFDLLKACFVSSAVMAMLLLLTVRFSGFARGVFIIDFVLTFLFVGGFRVAIRLFYSRMNGEIKVPALWTSRTDAKNILLVGAGDAGEKLLREIIATSNGDYYVVGFLDDDRQKLKRSIHGVPVLGTIDSIQKVVKKNKIDEIIISIPSAKGEQMRRIVSFCKETGKRFRTVPGIWELIEGKVSVKRVRDVTVADLLGREEVHLDEKEIRDYLQGKRILVTGAGGSIGSELVRQICRFDPEKLGLLDFSEFNLYKVAIECAQRFESVKTASCLVDIKDAEAVEKTFREFRPDVVFHAAAYKHVPMQELNPWQAVSNNVRGTRNLVEASARHGVTRFVLVSTDKAVRPSNVMGATKRVAEMLTECMNGRTGSTFMAVRFGNVLGSSGSVIPLFQDQILRGSPVTVTHEEVTRYFMSIPEAAQLILQAGAMGRGSEIFILDMGKPVRIIDMARDLIRLSGFEPETDIPIQITGLRPGEKLYEELITEGEGIVNTNHKKILVLQGNTCDRETLESHIDELLAVARGYDAGEIKKKLKEIVPEYTPQL